jgi:hypothetical protein
VQDACELLIHPGLNSVQDIVIVEPFEHLVLKHRVDF